MRLRRLAVVVALVALSHPAAAQDLVGTFRFAGCDRLLCEDVTYFTYRNWVWEEDHGHPRYLGGFIATVTVKPAFFALTNTYVSIRNSIASPDPGYLEWYEGMWGDEEVTPASPTVTIDYRTPIGRLDSPRIDAVYAIYWAVAVPEDIGRGESYIPLHLHPVASVTAPEPATLALVGGGLLALGGIVRRRRA